MCLFSKHKRNGTSPLRSHTKIIRAIIQKEGMTGHGHACLCAHVTYKNETTASIRYNWKHASTCVTVSFSRSGVQGEATPECITPAAVWSTTVTTPNGTNEPCQGRILLVALLETRNAGKRDKGKH